MQCIVSHVAHFYRMRPAERNSLADRSAGNYHQAAGNRNQRRAEVRSTYISRVKGPQNVCRGCFEECIQAQAGI